MKNDFVTNALLSRAAFYNQLLDGNDETRDVDAECGYPDSVSTADYITMYRRNDVASRVVTLEPDKCWQDYPEIYETDEERLTAFEKAVKKLVQKTDLFSYMERIDVVSGIGRYGVMFIGLDDGKPFSEPAPGFAESEPLPSAGQANPLYFRIFDESSARISQYEKDKNNPRYGLPLYYELDFQDTANSFTDANATPESETITVHWSRVIHVADVSGTTSEMFGFPRQEVVYNRLFDLRKINASSGEAYWKGGFPGYAFEVDPRNGELTEEDRESVKDEIYKWEQGLSRYFAGVGVTMKSLNPTVSNPQPFVDNALRMIALAKGYPLHELAANVSPPSDEELKAFRKKIDLRRAKFVNKAIIRATIDRMIQFGALPQTENDEDGEPVIYEIRWIPLAEMTETEKAEVGLKRTEALARYTTAGAEALVPLQEWLTKFLRLSSEEAEVIVKAKRSEFSPVLQELARGMSGQQNNLPSSIPAVPKGDDQKDPSKTPANTVQPPKN